MSGSRRSRRIRSGWRSAATAIASSPRAASSVPNPAARSTSRASFRFLSLSSTISTSGGSPARRAVACLCRRRRHRRILGACLSGSCSPRTSTWSARVSGACSIRKTSWRSQRCAETWTRCSTRLPQSTLTWWSRISACHLAARTRGSRPRPGCARRTPRSVSSCSASTRTPSYALALLKGGSEGRAYLLKERVSDLEQLVAAIGAVADGGSVLDPKVVEALVAENARDERLPAQRADPA